MIPNTAFSSAKIFTCFLFFIATISGCNREPLFGTWERVGDEYSGLQVTVTRNGETVVAQVSKVPPQMVIEGLFMVGDIKWRDIKHVSSETYEYKDLFKAKYSTGKIASTEYRDSILRVDSENTIVTRVFAKGNEDIGTEQYWKKVAR